MRSRPFRAARPRRRIRRSGYEPELRAFNSFRGYRHEVRYETERLFIWEDCPDDHYPWYSTNEDCPSLVLQKDGTFQTVEGENRVLAVSVPGMDQESVRRAVARCACLMAFRESLWKKAHGDPLDLVNEIESQDLICHAFLTGPATSGIAEDFLKPIRSIVRRCEVFVSPEVPEGILVALAGPEFLGRVCRFPDGVGILGLGDGASYAIVSDRTDVEMHRTKSRQFWKECMVSDIMHS